MSLACKEEVLRLRAELLQFMATRVQERRLKAGKSLVTHVVDFGNVEKRERFFRSHAVEALDTLAGSSGLSGEFIASTARFLKEPNFEKRMEAASGPLCEELGISEETMEEVFQVGRRCFEAEDTVQARNIFLLLTLLDNMNGNAYLSVGITQQTLKEYDAAIQAYTITSLIQPANPVPHLYLAECYVLTEKWADAEASVARAEKLMETHHLPTHRAHAVALHQYIARNR